MEFEAVEPVLKKKKKVLKKKLGADGEPVKKKKVLKQKVEVDEEVPEKKKVLKKKKVPKVDGNLIDILRKEVEGKGDEEGQEERNGGGKKQFGKKKNLKKQNPALNRIERMKREMQFMQFKRTEEVTAVGELTAVNLNNEIVAMRPFARRALYEAVLNLTKKLATENPTPEQQKGYEAELVILRGKKINPDDVTKLAIVNTKQYRELAPLEVKMPHAERALKRAACQKAIVHLIKKKFRVKYPNWATEAPFILQRLGKQYEKKHMFAGDEKEDNSEAVLAKIQKKVEKFAKNEEKKQKLKGKVVGQDERKKVEREIVPKVERVEKPEEESDEEEDESEDDVDGEENVESGEEADEQESVGDEESAGDEDSEEGGDSEGEEDSDDQPEEDEESAEEPEVVQRAETKRKMVPEKKKEKVEENAKMTSLDMRQLLKKTIQKEAVKAAKELKKKEKAPIDMRKVVKEVQVKERGLAVVRKLNLRDDQDFETNLEEEKQLLAEKRVMEGTVDEGENADDEETEEGQDSFFLTPGAAPVGYTGNARKQSYGDDMEEDSGETREYRQPQYSQRGGQRGRGVSRGGGGEWAGDRGGRGGRGGSRGGWGGEDRGAQRGGDFGGRGGRGAARGGFRGEDRGAPRGGDFGGRGGRGAARGGWGADRGGAAGGRGGRGAFEPRGRGMDRGGRGVGMKRGPPDESLHPSWVAKRKMKEQNLYAQPQGKKTVFADD